MLLYREKLCEKSFSDADIAREKLQFKMLDIDGDGVIDFTEFMKNEAIHSLAKHNKDDLVRFLHPLEVKSAEKMFQLLDENGDGTIDIMEARNKGFYQQWYDTVKKIYECKHATQSDKSAMSVGLHAVSNTAILMESDENGDGVVDWEEFLRGQSLFIIAARPNKAEFDFKM